MSNNGALTQLVAIGAQDSNYLSNDAKDSIFKYSDDKINNFVKATSSITAEGTPNWGRTINFKIEKRGDLLNSMFFVVKLPDLDVSNGKSSEWSDNYVAWPDYIGNLLIEYARFYIGGQLIDEQTGDFMQIHTDMYDDDYNKLCLIGMDGYLNCPQKKIDSQYIYVPLKFWFCDKLKKSLPIIALQYHEIELEIKIRDWENCYHILKQYTDSAEVDYYVPNYGVNPLPIQSIIDVRLDCNYIYVDSEERKRIAESDHKILITQTQRISQAVRQSKSVELNFNHPVKEIYFYIRANSMISQKEYFNFSNKTMYMSSKNKTKIIDTDNGKYQDWECMTRDHILGTAEILINGYPRAEKKDYKYYHHLQNYEYFKTCLRHYVYLYSFSGNPRSEKPMGSLNFSRIDNAQLNFTINDNASKNAKARLLPADQVDVDYENGDIVVFAVNHNYLIIKSGMAGLMYNN